MTFPYELSVDIEYDTTGLDDTAPLTADIIVDFTDNPIQQEDNR